MVCRFVVFLYWSFLAMVLGYPTGQIEQSCTTMLPMHGSSSPSTAAAPFTISASTNSFNPGDVITVTLQANSGSNFKGFLLQARTVVGDAIAGAFTITDATSQRLNCNSKASSAVSHKSSVQKTKVTAVWVAPSATGNVRFRATILQNYNTFWNRIESQTILASEISTNSALVTKSPETTINTTGNQGVILFQISSDNCGKTKTCFSNPTDCNPNTSANCIFMSILPASGGGFTFEMSGSSGGGYVATGFSDDVFMGNDDIFGCVLNAAGGIEVQRVFSNGKSISNPKPLGNSMENTITSYRNGVIKCSFTTRNNISTQARAANNEEYFIFLAYGPSQDGNMQFHSKTPAISNQKVNIMAFSIVGTKNSTRIIHVHGALMLIAWMTVGSIGMICARYLKTAGKQLFLGKTLWFQAHRLLMGLTVIATIIAFILAFVSQMRWNGGPHPVLGCIVMVLSFFQPILALFRPAPTAKRRVIFNWGHTLNALVIKVLAVAAIFLGLHLVDTSSNKWLDKVMGGFVAWEALIYIVLEMNVHLKRKDNSEEPDKSVTFEMVSFFIYVFGNVAFLIALLIGIGTSAFNSI